MPNPFRWPRVKHDIDLARDVAANNPEKPSDWDMIAKRLSSAFSEEDRVIEIKGRSCRERLDRLIEKYKSEDAKALKRSGTEEDFTELHQLLEDISTYRRDLKEVRDKENESKKRKDEDDKKKAEEMREAAMLKISERKHGLDTSISSLSSDEDEEIKSPDIKKTKGTKVLAKRSSKLSAVEMLNQKYDKKAEIREKELEVRKLELEFQKRKFEDEAEERKLRLQLEMQERKTMLELL